MPLVAYNQPSEALDAQIAQTAIQCVTLNGIQPLFLSSATTTATTYITSSAMTGLYNPTTTNSTTSGGIWISNAAMTTNGIVTLVTTGTTCGTQWYYHSGEQTPEQKTRAARYLKEERTKRLHAVHRAKGSIKRALKLIDHVGFGDDIRVFLGGDDIEVSHPDSMFKFVLSKPGYISLIEKTIHSGHSIPYNLQLYTKTNVHVASLCAVLESTPILDAVLAVSLFIKTGDEDHILERANWSSITDDEDILLEIGLYKPNLRSRFRHKRFKNPEIQDIFLH